MKTKTDHRCPVPPETLISKTETEEIRQCTCGLLSLWVKEKNSHSFEWVKEWPGGLIDSFTNEDEINGSI